MSESDLLARIEALENRQAIRDQRAKTATLRAMNALLALLILLEGIQLFWFLYFGYGIGLFQGMIERLDMELLGPTALLSQHWISFSILSFSLPLAIAGITYAVNCKNDSVGRILWVNLIALLLLKVALAYSFFSLCLPFFSGLEAM